MHSYIVSTTLHDLTYMYYIYICEVHTRLVDYIHIQIHRHTYLETYVIIVLSPRNYGQSSDSSAAPPKARRKRFATSATAKASLRASFILEKSSLRWVSFGFYMGYGHGFAMARFKITITKHMDFIFVGLVYIREHLPQFNIV